MCVIAAEYSVAEDLSLSSQMKLSAHGLKQEYTLRDISHVLANGKRLFKALL